MENYKHTALLRIINIIIIVLHIIFPLWAFALTCLYGYYYLTLPISFISITLTGILYINFSLLKIKKGKLILNIFRTISIISIIIFYVPMIVLISFRRTDIMYTFKRHAYTVGVYGNNAKYYQQLLPQKLPEKCDEYYFCTQFGFQGPDGHASSYLKFYTDENTIETYSKYYSSFDFEYKKIDLDEKGFTEDFNNFCNYLEIEYPGNFDPDNVELFWKEFGEIDHEAILLDHETGLVAIMT